MPCQSNLPKPKVIAVGISKKNLDSVKRDLKRDGYRGVSAMKDNKGYYTVFYRYKAKK